MSCYFIANICQGHIVLSIAHDFFSTSTYDIWAPIQRHSVYVGAGVVYCPSEQWTLVIVPNLLGYVIIISYFITHKVTSEVNTLTLR